MSTPFSPCEDIIARERAKLANEQEQLGLPPEAPSSFSNTSSTVSIPLVNSIQSLAISLPLRINKLPKDKATLKAFTDLIAALQLAVRTHTPPPPVPMDVSKDSAHVPVEAPAPPPTSIPCPNPVPKQKKAKPPPAMSYAKAAAGPPKPDKPKPRPSLVISVPPTNGVTLQVRVAGPTPPLVTCINEALASTPFLASTQVSAGHWTLKGNLVVVAGPDTTLAQLTAAQPIITKALADRFPGPDLHSRANLCWSKLLVNSVPTGVTGSSVAHTPTAIHNELLKENPAYCRLWITQLPTWVWRPDLYGPGSSSSLVFVFKDPDGSLFTSLLSSRFFFLFGIQSTLRKWINRRSTPAKLHTAWRKKGLLKSQTKRDSCLTQKDKEDKIASDHSIACPVLQSWAYKIFTSLAAATVIALHYAYPCTIGTYSPTTDAQTPATSATSSPVLLSAIPDLCTTSA